MTDLMAVLIGLGCGILAGVPTSALVLYALYRRDVMRAARRLPASRAEAVPERAPREVWFIIEDATATQLTVPEDARLVQRG